MPSRSAASGTCSHSSSTRSSSRLCSAYAYRSAAAQAAARAATRARGWSCAAYQWWAISAGARPAATRCGCGLDGGGVPGVQPGVLAGQQLVVDGLADQRVPELVVAVGVGHHELGGDGGAQRVLQLGLGQRRRPRRAAGGRSGCRRRRRSAAPAGPARAAGRPGPAAGRAGVSGSVGAADRVAGGGQLLDEERVALGAVVDVVDGPRRPARRRAGRRGSRPVPSRSSRPSSSRSTPRARSSSARNGRSGWPRCSSSVR